MVQLAAPEGSTKEGLTEETVGLPEQNRADANARDAARRRLRVQGVVQGVGFRPFVYRLAVDCGLGGFVLNDGSGVLIEVEGPDSRLREFAARLTAEYPPASSVEMVTTETAAPVGEASFEIRISAGGLHAATLVSPDLAVCEDCLREMRDPADRRYRYPFINCTNCGPRFTIVRGIPYDRPLTSMASFGMCPECAAEYADPANRRFHAQPNACPQCGPRLTLRDKEKELVTADPIVVAAVLLKQGKILAVRGLGGFHLAVDAANSDAIARLRERKGRAEKPFALMAGDIAQIKDHCAVSLQEQDLLLSPRRPIVLLAQNSPGVISTLAAPGQKYLGFMLPYTPLHHLLLEAVGRPLVMTSGNYSEEPIFIGNDEALERLASLADCFLLHNREILQRCDDSIVRVAGNVPRVIRRSRGFVPRPIGVNLSFLEPLLAVGGELKNTVALARGNHVFVSQHIGDLDHPSAFRFFVHCIDHLERLFEIRPQAVACDLHPGYLNTQWAHKQNLRVVAVQHHHAHLAAVMAENGVTERCLGIILDGTGYGSDGTIWGGEILIGDHHDFERVAWLEQVRMPGGNAAITEPWRMALSWLYRAYGHEHDRLDLPLLRRIDPAARGTLIQMIEQGINSPLTSSCGRLFDAVAALLGLGDRINYEAQTAIALEMIADCTHQGRYDSALGGKVSGMLSVVPLIRAVVDDVKSGCDKAVIAARFHGTLAELLVRAAVAARERQQINTVGLSGGVYQNKLFFETMLNLLQKQGFHVLTHTRVPANDGGLALGQAVVANARLRTTQGDAD